jgi:hypothetical protein
VVLSELYLPHDCDPKHATCSATDPGDFTCACHGGYFSEDAARTCLDIDECASEPCEHGSECMESGDGPTWSPATCVATALNAIAEDVAACAAVEALGDGTACRAVVGHVLTTTFVCTYTPMAPVPLSAYSCACLLGLRVSVHCRIERRCSCCCLRHRIASSLHLRGSSTASSSSPSGGCPICILRRRLWMRASTVTE